MIISVDPEVGCAMKLSINYELQDEDAVRGITALCDELDTHR